MRKVAEGNTKKYRSQEDGIMARSSFCSSNFKLCGALTVTFSNDSVSRSKRPLQDLQEGDQPLQLDAKRPRWEKFCGSPSPAQKTPPPSVLSSPSSRTASQAYPLTTNGYRDDSELDASLLEPSDGEEPDSPLGLSPEDEAKLLEDDPGDCVEPFPPFIVFGVHARKVESSCIPTSPKAQNISRAPEKTIGTEPLPLTGPSDLFSDGLACRSDSVVPVCGSHSNRGSRNQAGLGLHLNSPAFPEAVPIEASSVSLERGGDSSAVIDEEATRAVRDDSAVSRLTAGVSASLMAKGRSEEQGCIVQELGGESAGHPPGESEGEWNPANLLGEAATSRLHSASNQSEDHVENLSTKRPKSPVRPRQQIRISQADLEESMRSYINAVFAHAHHGPHLIERPLPSTVEGSCLLEDTRGTGLRETSGLTRPEAELRVFFAWLPCQNAPGKDPLAPYLSMSRRILKGKNGNRLENAVGASGPGFRKRRRMSRRCSRHLPSGPVNELHALMQRVSSESHFQGHSFRHPADLTMRNYAERVNRPTQRCTLGQWVIRNQRDRPLFADIPDRFERSPIPSL